MLKSWGKPCGQLQGLRLSKPRGWPLVLALLKHVQGPENLEDHQLGRWFFRPAAYGAPVVAAALGVVAAAAPIRVAAPILAPHVVAPAAAPAVAPLSLLNSPEKDNAMLNDASEIRRPKARRAAGFGAGLQGLTLDWRATSNGNPSFITCEHESDQEHL
jgi:hypothetical protein